MSRFALTWVHAFSALALGCGPEPAPFGGWGAAEAERLPVVFGHRGSGPTHPSRVYPDNTTASVELALDDGAEGVEVDVWMTRDGVLVLGHDDVLSHLPWEAGTRRTLCFVNVSESNWSDIRDDCPVLSPDIEREPLPLGRLDDVLALGERGGRLLIDLKVDDDPARAVEARAAIDAVARALETEGDPSRVMLSLYQSDTRAYAQERGLGSCLKYHGHLGWSAETLTAEVARVDDWGLCTNYCIVDAALVEGIHAMGQRVLVYANDPDGGRVDERNMPQLLANVSAFQVDALLTDDVALAIELRDDASALAGVTPSHPFADCRGELLLPPRP